MSHFTVLVIGPDPEKQLAPYQENNIGDCPKEYLEFHDVEEKYRKEYEEETRKEFYCSSNSSWGMRVSEENYEILKNRKIGEKQILIISKSSDIGSYFQKDKRYRCYWNEKDQAPKEEDYVWIHVIKIIETPHPDKTVCFEGIIEVEVVNPPKEISHKEKYATFEEFIKDWAGFKEKDEVTGKYGYWENPNKKWDWYSLGGRWRGFFKLKHPNQETVVGSPGTFDNSPEFDSDQALKKDIDFEGMEKAEAQEAKEKYEMVERLFGGEIPKIEHRWKDIINEKNEKYNKMNYDEKREFYHTQPALMKKEELRKQLRLFAENTCPFSKEEREMLVWLDLEDYQCSKEEYIQTAKAKAFVTFAVVKDGKWYERGKMGWWRCVLNEKDMDEWCNKFYTLIHDLPDDTLLSVYDCHI